MNHTIIPYASSMFHFVVFHLSFYKNRLCIFDKTSTVNPYLGHFGNALERHLWTENPHLLFKFLSRDTWFIFDKTSTVKWIDSFDCLASFRLDKLFYSRIEFWSMYLQFKEKVRKKKLTSFPKHPFLYFVCVLLY